MADTGTHDPSRVRLDIALINEIRDDEELTAMARIIEAAQREAWWQGFGSDWDKARFSAYMLRRGGFGAAPAEDATGPGRSNEHHEGKEHHVPD
jgi:hypothetical protein